MASGPTPPRPRAKEGKHPAFPQLKNSAWGPREGRQRLVQSSRFPWLSEDGEMLARHSSKRRGERAISPHPPVSAATSPASWATKQKQLDSGKTLPNKEPIACIGAPAQGPELWLTVNGIPLSRVPSWKDLLQMWL